MKNYYSEIKPVLNKLSQLNVFDSLDVIRKYVYCAIYERFDNADKLPDIEESLYNGIEVSFADFLIKNSIIYSSVLNEKRSLKNAKTRKEICAPIIEMQHKVYENRMKDHPSIWVGAYFYNQLNMQPEGNEKIMLYRQFYVYNDPKVREIIENHIGFPLDNYFRMIFFLYACYANTFCYSIKDLFLFHKSNENPDTKALKYILSVISKPLSELKKLCKEDSRYDEDRILEYYSDSPHIQYPLIDYDEKLYCVVPAYILFSTFDHIYHILNENNDQDTRHAFANKFENYIGDIFRHYFSETKIHYHSEITYIYHKKEKATSDWIIWDETDICFVDCKIKRMTIPSLKANSIDTNLLNSIIDKKPSKSEMDTITKQLEPSLTKDIIRLGIDLGKIFVSYDDYKQSHINEFPYMPNKKFHACLLMLEQNLCRIFEIKDYIIKIAQMYREKQSKTNESIHDDEVLILSARDMERDIPLMAKVGIAKVMEWEQNGDIYKRKVDNVFLKDMCKLELIDTLMQDIHEKVGQIVNK